MKTFYIEETDTFAGEANYSYVCRYLIKANTPRGAMRKMFRGWRKVWDSGYMIRFDSESGLTCYFVEEVTQEEAEEKQKQYSRISMIS